MGQLLDLMFGSDPIMSVDIDFQNIAPVTPAEEEYCGTAMEMHARAMELFHSVTTYEGCVEAIRAAMQHPSDEQVQVDAFNTLLPNVQIIQQWHELSIDLIAVVDQGLAMIADSASLQEHPSVAKVIGDLLVFAFNFDQEKMLKPAIQNDFSFYRRVLPKVVGRVATPIDESVAGVISMFVAENTPFISALSNGLKNYMPFANLANLCAGMINRGALEMPENQEHVLKVMVTSIVLYDRKTVTGVFNNSPVKMRRCINATNRGPENMADILKNTIKYFSRNYKDAPEWQKEMLGD